MRVERHHIVLSGAVIAIGVMLGFAVSFLVDASSTNRAFDALAAHHVALPGHELGCAWVGPSTRASSAPTRMVCRIGYDYRGTGFTEVIGYGQSKTAYVDPTDPEVHMTKVSFDNGPRETTGDLAIASALIAGAIGVGVLHEVHRRRMRRFRGHA